MHIYYTLIWEEEIWIASDYYISSMDEQRNKQKYIFLPMENKHQVCTKM